MKYFAKLSNHVKPRRNGSVALDLTKTTRVTKQEEKSSCIMVLLDNDGFLSQLTFLLNKTKSKGCVRITLKKYNGQTKPKPRDSKKTPKAQSEHDHGENRCLFRATSGSKKISTVVNAKDVNRFQMAYANVLKANMDNLKKRDRKGEKRKSTKAKASQ